MHRSTCGELISKPERGRPGIPKVFFAEQAEGRRQRTVSVRRFRKCKVRRGETDSQGAPFLQEPGAFTRVTSRLSSPDPAKHMFSAATSLGCAHGSLTRSRVFFPLPRCVTRPKPELEPRFSGSESYISPPSSAVRAVNGGYVEHTTRV